MKCAFKTMTSVHPKEVWPSVSYPRKFNDITIAQSTLWTPLLPQQVIPLWGWCVYITSVTRYWLLCLDDIESGTFSAPSLHLTPTLRQWYLVDTVTGFFCFVFFHGKAFYFILFYLFKGIPLFLLFIYLFIYFWLCWVFVSVQGLSLVAASGGHSSSWCVGLSLSRPLLLRSTSSRCAGSVVVAHGPSCSLACGIFPDQGPNPCPLH